MTNGFNEKTNKDSTNTNKWFNIIKRLKTVGVDLPVIDNKNQTIVENNKSMYNQYEPNFEIFECDICGGEDCKDECVNM